MRRHYGSLDAVDGFFLRVDPVSDDVSPGSDGGRRGVETFSRKLDLAMFILNGLLVQQYLSFVLECPSVVVIQGC